MDVEDVATNLKRGGRVYLVSTFVTSIYRAGPYILLLDIYPDNRALKDTG